VKRVPSASGASSNTSRSEPQVNSRRRGGSTTSTVPVAASLSPNALKRIAPPLRRSSSTGLGNHWPRCSGIVTARHTFSTGCG
jgi:hypothetical protein